MPVIYERPVSRGFLVDAKTEGLLRQYFVSGTNDEEEVLELLLATSPRQLGAMARKSVKAESLSNGHWYGDVEYSTIDLESSVGVEPGSVAPAEVTSATLLNESFSIDTTGATAHITQALSTRYRVTAADPNPPVAGGGKGSGADEKLAIGLTKDRVEGTDIYSPAFTFSKTVQRQNVSFDYAGSVLYKLVGCVNDAKFYSFAAGQVLYLGCSGSCTLRDRWTLTYKFACSPNEVNIDVGGAITVPKKGGWEYLWVGYAPNKVANQILQVPQVAYVQQVYKPANFALLEIGV